MLAAVVHLGASPHRQVGVREQLEGRSLERPFREHQPQHKSSCDPFPSSGFEAASALAARRYGRRPRNDSGQQVEHLERGDRRLVTLVGDAGHRSLQCLSHRVGGEHTEHDGYSRYRDSRA